jgi:hypothetical protein
MNGIKKNLATAVVVRMVSDLALGLATCVGMSGQTTTTKGATTHMSIQEVQVQRVSIVTPEPFDTVVARIDAAPFRKKRHVQ